MQPSDPDLRPSQAPLPPAEEQLFDTTGGSPVVVMQPTRRSKKKLAILIVLLLLVAGAAAWFLLLRNEPDVPAAASDTKLNASAGTSIANVPRYDSVRAVVDFQDAKWYVVDGGVVSLKAGKAKFYSNTQGVPTGTPQNAIVHKGRLWLASQDGVAYLDTKTDRFVASKVGDGGGLSNGNLFYDANDKKMYLNDFENFYVYNDKTGGWDRIEGPKNAMSFAANDRFIALYASKEGWPIWVYDKQTKKWEKKSPAIEEQSGTVFAMGGDILIAGRTLGYTSCEMAGRITATSVFRLNKDGDWQAFDDFNADKNRPELQVLKTISKTVTVQTSPCDSSKGTLYDLAASGNSLALRDQRENPYGYSSSNDIQEQLAYMSQISKATGLHPSMHVLDVDGKGNVIFSYADKYSGSSTAIEPLIAVAKGDVLSKATKLDMAELKDGENYPILCGSGAGRELRYVFSGDVHIAQSAHEGFPDGTWGSSKLYKVDGSKLTLIADLNGDIATPVFACNDKQLVWLGKTGLRRMDLASNVVTLVGKPIGSDIRYNASAAEATASGGLWFSQNINQAGAATLYYYAAAKGAYETVAANIDVGMLSAASDSRVMVDSSVNKEPKQSIYDRSGKEVQVLEARGPAVYVAKNDAYLVVVKRIGDTAVFSPYFIHSLKVGAKTQPAAVKNNGFSVRYEMDGSTFGLRSRPVMVYDAARTRLWLNDSAFGINGITISN